MRISLALVSCQGLVKLTALDEAPDVFLLLREASNVMPPSKRCCHWKVAKEQKGH